jgi:hypothetical protein
MTAASQRLAGSLLNCSIRSMVDLFNHEVLRPENQQAIEGIGASEVPIRLHIARHQSIARNFVPGRVLVPGMRARDGTGD